MNSFLSLKTASARPPKLAGGHRLCPGCGLGIIVKQVLATTTDPVIVVNATGCLEICTSPFPQTSWQTPWIHSLFENAAAVASGIDAARKAFIRKTPEISRGIKPQISGGIKNPKTFRKIKIIAFAGDGGTYDIGLQALSGAVERGHDFTFVCLDNEGYMNTGYQRSSASPLGAATSTSPTGKKIHGKQTVRKDIIGILAAHCIPYVAQATPANHLDLMAKAAKAINTPGPAFLNIFSPCPTNWKSAPAAGMEICQNAVETNFWPLCEAENGKWKINYQPKKRQIIEEFLKGQKRFRHLLKKENVKLKNRLQLEVDARWQRLLQLAKIR
ncbi:pyruvate ferredoxin oxidoreductase [Patescibacteria group bacterium]|nr:pyruvate ferredoxin oxidoreductase [Patescibacteria group bacterium]